jgi:D-alanyl-D-alanine carboxypeptidase
LPGSPAGSAYSTAGDLVRFFDALEAGKLVQVDMVKEMTRAHINAAPPGAPVTLQYGLGFGVSPWEGRQGYGHNGGAPGVNVELMRYPADDVLIVLLSNRDPPHAARMLSSLRRAALGGTLCR